jgi:hypothetical protein
MIRKSGDLPSGTHRAEFHRRETGTRSTAVGEDGTED